ncbi:MAG: hypothetical protein HY319_28180 [Armatimonadetes bacterium]|nr:hypothetical protein [Armatimonadota bacterium]
MLSYFTDELPPAIQSVIQSPAGTTFEQIANQAVSALTMLDSPDVQSTAGQSVLVFLQGRGDSRQQEFVDRALQVMDKFPNYPRPRAAVALQALKTLAQKAS